MALAQALDVDPRELLGPTPEPRVIPELLAYLDGFDEAAQRRILSALRELQVVLGHGSGPGVEN